MKRISTILLIFHFSFFIFHFAYAQDAMKVLDIAAERIQKAGNVKIEYKASIFAGATEKASASGTMWLQGSKMKLDVDGIITWYDGKTRWCYVPSAKEVNIDEPSKKEMAAMNPYTFMNIYKKGFSMTVKETASHDEQKDKGTVTPDTSDHNDIMQWMLILGGSSMLSLILLIAAVRIKQTK